MKNIRNASGFTLIELVMVIVILGILAAVAAPKLYNYRNQAHVSNVAGTVGGISSGITIFQSTWLVQPSLIPPGATATSNGLPMDLDGLASAAVDSLFRYVLQQPIGKDWKKNGAALTTSGTSVGYTYTAYNDTVITYYNSNGIVK